MNFGESAFLSLIYALLFGGLASVLVNITAAKLPDRLMAQWVAEANSLLETSAEAKPDVCLKRYCTVRYVYILMTAIFLTFCAIYVFGCTLRGVGYTVFGLLLLVLSVIDFETRLLPDIVVLPAMWLGIAANSFGLFIDCFDSVWGAIAGYLFLWSVHRAFQFVTGRQALGHGDMKLMAAIGAFGGWGIIGNTVFFASVTALLATVLRNIFLPADAKDQNLAFGPYLAVGGWISALIHFARY